MIAYRDMNISDIEAGLSLCRAAKWNQLAGDWEIFLKLNPGGCRVASDDQKVIGTVTTLRYQQSFSWIGMVLVDPDHRRKGIGIQLLNEALHVLYDEETVKLDATPAGREVYLRLNFMDEYNLSRMNMLVKEKFPGTERVQQMTDEDFIEIENSDRVIFGADRSALLNRIWKSAPQYAFVSKENNRINGYCFGRKGYNYDHIGPIIAGNIQTAKDILTAALNVCIGQPVIIDTMHFDKEWLHWIASIGFTEQRSFVRMYRGTNAFESIPQKQYAIAGPEFG